MKEAIRNSLLLAIVAACIFGGLYALPSHAWVVEDELDEFEVGQFCTVYDEADPAQVIFTSGRFVSVGDEYQTDDDRLFQVVRVEGQDRAYARFVRQVGLDDLRTDFSAILDSMLAAKAAPGKQVTVGLYHTHSDESYTPTDGSSSIRGNGGIYKVGNALASSLEKEGVNVIHSQAKHDPHDVAAYKRSRRTAKELLRKSTAVLDVHRDAVPKEQYSGTVNGQKVAKVQLVVGRQNPNMATNRQFARELKAAADKQQPGLVKGIFFARSGYNQDLNPRNLLLEVGTDKHSRAEAEKGVSMFAKSYASYLSASTAGSQAGQQREGRVGTSTAFWLVGLVVVGAAVYMLLSTGSLEELGSKIRTFGTKEFSDTLPRGKGDQDKNK
ncbi:MAG TPA: stage II sporulation protein P [Firmicutes bacterium]|nr:stage II sporulation protein P [Bacillota bacterium]